MITVDKIKAYASLERDFNSGHYDCVVKPSELTLYDSSHKHSFALFEIGAYTAVNFPEKCVVQRTPVFKNLTWKLKKLNAVNTDKVRFVADGNQDSMMLLNFKIEGQQYPDKLKTPIFLHENMYLDYGDGMSYFYPIDFQIPKMSDMGVVYQFPPLPGKSAMKWLPSFKTDKDEYCNVYIQSGEELVIGIITHHKNAILLRKRVAENTTPRNLYFGIYPYFKTNKFLENLESVSIRDYGLQRYAVASAGGAHSFMQGREEDTPAVELDDLNLPDRFEINFTDLMPAGKRIWNRGSIYHGQKYPWDDCAIIHLAGQQAYFYVHGTELNLGTSVGCECKNNDALDYIMLSYLHFNFLGGFTGKLHFYHCERRHDTRGKFAC